ncbi:dUTP diphosphatase [Melghirimyces profundicolus]|nr:dUTP diphosphatase [Melghirimyces profundicolus]
MIRKLPGNEDLPLPTRMSDGASGFDLYAAIPEEFFLEPGEWKLIPAGFALEMPEGLEAQVRPRSGLALKYGVTVLNAPGTVDADYRGEVSVLLHNLGKQPFPVRRGDRIAQLVFQEVAPVRLRETEHLKDTPRGAGGFGHTGK